MTSNDLPIEKRILQIYEKLPPGERSLADLLMELRGDFIGYSATELAGQASVSKATAARLFKRLDYSSFEDARQSTRRNKHWGSPLKRLLTRSESQFDPNLGEHLIADSANLRKTFERITIQQLDDALEILSSGATIWILGLRNSYGMAHYARFTLNMLRPDVRLIPQGGLSFAEEVLNMKSGDGMLVIGFRRRPLTLKRVMSKAKESGVRIVFITDISASSTAKLADVVFRCHSRVPYLYDSYTAAISLLNFLSTSLALRLGETGIDRLNRIDDLHDELDAFSHNRG